MNPYDKIDVPNAFTPDQGGPDGGSYDLNSYSNDVFFPITKYVTKVQMMIFNRWGELIFESVDIDIGWDGYYRGKLCQQDVYAWKIKLTYADGKEITKVGDLTLVR